MGWLGCRGFVGLVDLESDSDSSLDSDSSIDPYINSGSDSTPDSDSGSNTASGSDSGTESDLGLDSASSVLLPQCGYSERSIHSVYAHNGCALDGIGFQLRNGTSWYEGNSELRQLVGTLDLESI